MIFQHKLVIRNEGKGGWEVEGGARQAMGFNQARGQRGRRIMGR